MWFIFHPSSPSVVCLESPPLDQMASVEVGWWRFPSAGETHSGGSWWQWTESRWGRQCSNQSSLSGLMILWPQHCPEYQPEHVKIHLQCKVMKIFISFYRQSFLDGQTQAKYHFPTDTGKSISPPITPTFHVGISVLMTFTSMTVSMVMTSALTMTMTSAMTMSVTSMPMRMWTSECNYSK